MALVAPKAVSFVAEVQPDAVETVVVASVLSLRVGGEVPSNSNLGLLGQLAPEVAVHLSNRSHRVPHELVEIQVVNLRSVIGEACANRHAALEPICDSSRPVFSDFVNACDGAKNR